MTTVVLVGWQEANDRIAGLERRWRDRDDLPYLRNRYCPRCQTPDCPLIRRRKKKVNAT